MDPIWLPEVCLLRNFPCLRFVRTTSSHHPQPTVTSQLPSTRRPTSDPAHRRSPSTGMPPEPAPPFPDLAPALTCATVPCPLSPPYALHPPLPAPPLPLGAAGARAPSQKLVEMTISTHEGGTDGTKAFVYPLSVHLKIIYMNKNTIN